MTSNNVSDPELSQEFEDLPEHIQLILESFVEFDNTYEDCRELDRLLAEVGWECEWGLDAVPYDFKPIFRPMGPVPE